jgi:hypothetical protein
LNGVYYWITNYAPTKIYTATSIGGPFTENTISGGLSVVSPYFIWAAGDLLITKLNTGLAYSRNGIDWTLFPDSLTPYPYAKVNQTPDGLIFVVDASDDIAIKDYVPSVTSSTFDVPYPAEGEAPAPWAYYVRAF